MIKTRLPAKPRKKKTSGSFGPESKLQDFFLQWLSYALPHIRKRLCSIPNSGLRSKAEGARQVQLGLRAGMPDLFIFTAYGPYHGLFIELKWDKNTLTEHQKNAIKDLIDEDYCCAVCYTFEEAKEAVSLYIQGKGSVVQQKTCQLLGYSSKGLIA